MRASSPIVHEMVYLVKPNYPPLYLDSGKKAMHAVAWGVSTGPKYFYGNKNESLWAQEIHQKAVNTKDNTYQLELERGTHKSIPLYEQVYGARKEPEWKEYRGEPTRRAKGRFQGSMHRPLSAAESRLHKTVHTMKGIHSTLLSELAATTNSLNEANEALNGLEQTTFGRSFRSVRARPHSAAPQLRSTRWRSERSSMRNSNRAGAR